MPDYASECAAWSNDCLVFKEISHRRSIASYVTSLTLTAGTTAGTMGAAAPLTIPIGTFKLYKINSHKSKLKTVRAELSRRHLSPTDKRKRDVLVPVAITFTVYATTLGLADMIDIVPSDVQSTFESQIDDVAHIDQGSTGADSVGDKYQAFILAEAVSPLTNATMQPTPPPSQVGSRLPDHTIFALTEQFSQAGCYSKYSKGQ
ncbi:hypothetical protein FRC12_012198 [Ceratobasidium sp. 428]|nr:hypothetical protein FRC12_012198 [Ceratobasidium sp. 428]